MLPLCEARRTPATHLQRALNRTDKSASVPSSASRMQTCRLWFEEVSLYGPSFAISVTRPANKKPNRMGESRWLQDLDGLADNALPVT